MDPVAKLLFLNLERGRLILAVEHWVLFMGLGWVLVFLGLRRAPEFVYRMALLVPLYLPAVLVFGVWFEVRLLMPMYPVLLPLLLTSLYGQPSRAGIT